MKRVIEAEGFDSAGSTGKEEEAKRPRQQQQ